MKLPVVNARCSFERLRHAFDMSDRHYGFFKGGKGYTLILGMVEMRWFGAYL